MDREFLEQLTALGRLNLPLEVVREVLEHEKWKIREQHKHEREMLSLSGQSQPSAANQSLDSDFNLETGGELAEIGLIAKRKVAKAAEEKARDLENPSNLPLPLLSLFITISWCGERLGRWPKAKDAKVAISVKDDLEKAIEKYGVRKVYSAYELISTSLDSWDQRLISERLESLNESYEEIKTSSFSSSPVFIEFAKFHPHIPPDLFDKCYEQNDQDFIKSAIHLLRKEFISSPPPELKHISGWQQRYLQH
uniref:hypothetical protein n=1 Tax=Vulcanococcus sp. TaxID=2856995 RepID=UPI003F697B9B